MARNRTADEVFTAAFAAGLAPDPDYSVSEWADHYRQVPSEVSARPGAWSTEVVPFLRQIMDCLSASDPTERVVLMKSAQVSGTEAAINWLMYVADAAPGPAQVVHPTTELAKGFVREKWKPSVDATAKVRAKIVEQKSRDGGSTTQFSKFPGGFIRFTGANSGASFRQRSVRFMVKDDLDGWPADCDGEGDPSKLADKRTTTYWNRKIFEVSTPTTKASSRIYRSYRNSDQRIYKVPCPECGHYQRLVWDQLRWEAGQPATAAYECEDCGCLIPHSRKGQMLAGGYWEAQAPGEGKAAGFHLSELYSPFSSWAAMVSAFENAADDEFEQKVFWNTALGETWEEKGEAPPWETLFDRREAYPVGRVPPGVIFLTAGVDVQRDRLEYEVVGWDDQWRSWSIEYGVLDGDTSQPEVWQALATVARATYPDVNNLGRPIEMMAVDAGYQTEMVYGFCRTRENAMAVKGSNAKDHPDLGRPKKVDFTFNGRLKKKGAVLWIVGDHRIKQRLYDWFRQSPPREAGEEYPFGYCHFPAYTSDYFKQLTAERLVLRQRRGFTEYEWEKTGRNEALDCRKYSYAAAVRYRQGFRDAERLRRQAEAVGIETGPEQVELAELWSKPVPKDQETPLAHETATGRLSRDEQADEAAPAAASGGEQKTLDPAVVRARKRAPRKRGVRGKVG